MESSQGSGTQRHSLGLRVGLLVGALAISLLAALLAAQLALAPAQRSGGDALAIYSSPGQAAGGLDQPRTIALAEREGLAFVADRSGRVLRFAFDQESGRLRFEHEWRLPQTAAGYPAVIHWDEHDGSLLIGETHYGRVSRHDADGRRLQSFGRVGRGPGEFERIQGLASDPAGRIYVCDTFLHTERVQVFDSRGAWLLQWGGEGTEPGRFNRPSGIAIGPQGEVVVSDAVNHRLQVFSPEGELLRVLQPAGLVYPYDVDIDGAGNVYTVGFTTGTVMRITPEGLVSRWGSPGGGPRELAQPWGLAVTRGGTVLVADTRNHRIVALRMPRAEGER